MQKLDLTISRINSFRVSEAYKVIRTNLIFSGRNTKAVAFTSTLEDEGKSTVSWNVAMALADSRKNVLFIDADMRKSVFAGKHRIATRTLGLSHLLTGQASLDEVIYSTDIDRLCVMLTGVFPPNPAELLSYDVFADTIEKLKTRFDYIIIDTPPLGAAIDAAVVTSVCDASVLIIDYTHNSRKLAENSVEQLRKTGKPILGAILNKVEKSGGLYGRYYGKYYSKYGYTKYAKER